VSIVEQARTELVRAFNAIPGDRGVTARRALESAERAIADYEAQVCLLKWERERVELVAAQRAEREAAEKKSREEFLAEAARIERKGQRKLRK
jgi:hypothetical protein